MDPKSTPGEKWDDCSNEMLIIILGELLGAAFESPKTKAINRSSSN
jgi:hypothetical protein